jgi:integrase/recombinase XerD
MSELRKRFTEDLRLRGHSPKTIDAYVAAVRDLARHTGRSPDGLDEKDVRRYFIDLRERRKLSESSIRQRKYGLRLFYDMTMGRPMKILDHIQIRKSHRLPLVLNRQEVLAVLRCVKRPVSRMCLTTIYSCGLRLQEGLQLQAKHIDGERRMVRVEQGKGCAGTGRRTGLATRDGYSRG